ncbi:MAG: hypothetical protein RIT45_3076 [Pseudomonadota bacterium]|jgi:DNA primase
MAGRIPERILREVVERSDMVAVVGDVVKLSRSGASLRGLCPFHGEKTASFYVNPREKLYFCHGCGAGGDVVKFVREIRGLSFGEAVEWLGERCGVRVEREDLDPAEAQRRAQERSERGRLLELNAAAQAFFVRCLHRPEGAQALSYAERRGLEPETLERFGVGAAPDSWDALSQDLLGRGFAPEELVQVGLAMPKRSGNGLIDRFRDRLMYPVHASTGDLVAFGGRDLSDRKDVAKYMNSPESEVNDLGDVQNSRLWKFFKKSHVVFGLWLARGGIRREGAALLVEGNLDVMTLHQAGLDNAIAPMGTALTGEQLAEVHRFTNRVVLCFDGDKAGRAATLKSIPLALAAGLDGKVVRLPPGEDPDSYVRREGVAALRALIDSADDLVTSYIEALVADWDGTIHGRLDVARQALPAIGAIPDPIAREMARDTLATRLFSGDVAAGRHTLSQVERQVKPLPRTTVEARQPQLPPEPPVPKLELELAEAAMWKPELLLEYDRIGALDFVRHPGLRHALVTLAERAKTSGAANRQSAQAWLSVQADSNVRRALMKALIDEPRVAEAELAAHVESVIDSLEIAALERYRAELEAGMRRNADPEGARRVFEIRARIEMLRSKRRGESTTRDTAAKPAAQP